MELNNVIKRILKEEFTIQMCKAPEVNERLKLYKYYRKTKCDTTIFKDEMNNINEIKKHPYKVIQTGKYKGRDKTELLTDLNNGYQKRLNETCGGVIFKGKEKGLNNIGTDPCTIPSIINDYKNEMARKAFNKNMVKNENEDIFSGEPISQMK